jgi:hypothetical protein
LPVTLRQTHVPGQKLFVDYSGKKLGIVNPDTGEIREAELFVAALGVSGYTFAELTWTQQLSDWIGSHVRAFAFYEGLCEVLVPDNLRSGVSKANFYEPEKTRRIRKWQRIIPWPSSLRVRESPVIKRKRSSRCSWPRDGFSRSYAISASSVCTLQTAPSPHCLWS